MWVGWLKRRSRPGTVDPHPFALPVASLPEAQALSQWERVQSGLPKPQYILHVVETGLAAADPGRGGDGAPGEQGPVDG
jgi:hypothetical protein